MPAVQFYGLDAVMTAAENMKCPCWAIFYSGKLFCKYEDTDFDASMDILEQNLVTLQKSDSAAIYALKFFECKDNPVKINERTVCDAGSFNFKMMEETERQGNQIGFHMSQVVRDTEERMKLSHRIEKLEEEKKALIEKEPDSIGSALIDLFKRPSELAQLINIARAALGMPVQNLGNIIGHTRAIGNETEAMPQEEKLERLENALNALEKADPNLITHLEKLANMATNNPDQFKGTVGILDLS